MPRPPLCLVLALGTAFAGVAQAATITQDISLPPFSVGYNGTSSQDFYLAPFNPALGTLTSVTTTLTGDYNASVPSSSAYDNSFFIIQLANAGSLIAVTSGPNHSSGMYSISDSYTDTAPGDLTTLIGTNPVKAKFVVFENADATISGSDFTADVTYNYTPAVAVAATPEPSSLVLLGTGAFGVLASLRRRLT